MACVLWATQQNPQEAALPQCKKNKTAGDVAEGRQKQPATWHDCDAATCDIVPLEHHRQQAPPCVTASGPGQAIQHNRSRGD